MTECVGGALLSPPDEDDLIFENLAAAPDGMYCLPLPEELDLRPQLSIRDQGFRPTCVANVGATISQAQTKNLMSPEFIYYHRSNKPGRGMYGRDLMRILNKIGSVLELKFPYRTDEKAPSPDELLPEAAQNKIAGYSKVTTINGLKQALNETGPALIILPCYSNEPQFWNSADSENTGCHAVTVVGYDRTGLILQNSWGADWNGDGCTLLPYEDWNKVLECWSVTSA